MTDLCYYCGCEEQYHGGDYVNGCPQFRSYLAWKEWSKKRREIRKETRMVDNVTQLPDGNYITCVKCGAEYRPAEIKLKTSEGLGYRRVDMACPACKTNLEDQVRPDTKQRLAD
jgi:hypothetical protein